MEASPVVVAPAGRSRSAGPLARASDARLVALVRRGDERAFELLYDRHHRAILAFCRHMLGSRDEAEDALQHTFLAAFRSLTSGTQRIELRPWLFTIARNRCLSILRARRPHVDIALVEPSTDGLAASVERREDVRVLLADLAELPEQQRAALLLSELGALDHDGIAAVLGCRREQVKALVFQARSSLAASRQARETPCEQIRLELASATGAALRRGPLRRHLRICPGCAAFKAEVAAQRKLMALALPVLPSAALKAGVLAHALGGAHGAASAGAGVSAAGGLHAAAAAGAGTGASAGGLGASGGVLGTLTSLGAAKVAVSLTLAGVLAGGGLLTATGTLRRSHQAHASAASHGHRAAASAPAVTVPVAPTVPARGPAHAGSTSHSSGVHTPSQGTPATTPAAGTPHTHGNASQHLAPGDHGGRARHDATTRSQPHPGKAERAPQANSHHGSKQQRTRRHATKNGRRSERHGKPTHAEQAPTTPAPEHTSHADRAPSGAASDQAAPTG